MCDTCDGPGLSRRSLIAGTGVAAAGLGLGVVSPAAAAANQHPSRPKPKPFKGTELALLGTAAGPPPEPDRAGISNVLHVGGKNYLIDCGRGTVTNYFNIGLAFADLQSIFLTHLHADHICDYYNVFMLAGWGVSDYNDELTQTVDVYGPGPAGGLQPPFRGGEVPTVNPSDPTPGLADMTRRLIDAYAYTSNLFIRDSGSPDPRDLIRVHENVVPDVGASFAGPTAPDMQPFPVMEDDRIRVSAILVPHGPVFPAFAYRVETDDGVIVFSGDTSVSDNVVRLAEGADMLVHEVIDLEALGELPPAALDHLKASHTSVADVGKVAEAAGVETLVLTHFVPSAHAIVSPARWKRRAQRGFRGKVVVGEDLMRLRLPARRRSRR